CQLKFFFFLPSFGSAYYLPASGSNALGKWPCRGLARSAQSRGSWYRKRNAQRPGFRSGLLRRGLSGCSIHRTANSQQFLLLFPTFPWDLCVFFIPCIIHTRAHLSKRRVPSSL
ncbi:unnamed protein product, partial [Scytosiphon promiscuus]